MATVPPSLAYSGFDVDSLTQAAVQTDVDNLDVAQGQSKNAVVSSLQTDFNTGFTQAVANAVALASKLVPSTGSRCW